LVQGWTIVIVYYQPARVVLQASWTASATDMRRQLHWLPVRQRIVFKLATVTYKARLSGLPAYLQCEIHVYHPSRTLRSTSALLLQQQSATKSFAVRERFVQPLLQSGTLLVSTPVQLIRFWHLRTSLKLNCLNFATRNCFWHHHSVPDSLVNWHVGRIRNLFVCMYVWSLLTWLQFNTCIEKSNGRHNQRQSFVSEAQHIHWGLLTVYVTFHVSVAVDRFSTFGQRWCLVVVFIYLLFIASDTLTTYGWY